MTLKESSPVNWLSGVHHRRVPADKHKPFLLIIVIRIVLDPFRECRLVCNRGAIEVAFCHFLDEGDIIERVVLDLDTVPDKERVNFLLAPWLNRLPALSHLLLMML